MESLHSKYDVFNYEALTTEGKSLDENMHISLLNDGDITFLMKNTLNDPSVAEYFSRKDRRHPLWKSEAEYKAIFGMGFNDTLFQTVENELEELQKYLNFTTKSREMNNAALAALNADIQSTQKLLSAESSAEKQARIKAQLASKQKHLNWLLCFKSFADQQNIEFDFVVKRKCGLEVGKNYNLPKSEDARQAPTCPPEKRECNSRGITVFGDDIMHDAIGKLWPYIGHLKVNRYAKRRQGTKSLSPFSNCALIILFAQRWCRKILSR